MKKILVVLLVLAVATGVFAQEGEWSLYGSVEIGTYIDFDPDLNDGPDEQSVFIGSGYNEPYGYYGPITGKLGLNYNLDALGVNIRFDQADEKFAGGITYDGGSFKFQADSTLSDIIQGKNHIGRLWGYYKLLNEMIHLEVAYNSRDSGDAGWWDSDRTGAFWDVNPYSGGERIVSSITDVAWLYGSGWDSEAKAPGVPSVGGSSFTKVDHNDFLLADIQLGGFSFGVMLPHIFLSGNVHDNANSGVVKADNYKGFPKNLYWVDAGDGFALIDEVFKKMVFGLKFQMQPIEIAAQLLVDDYGVYFGGKWFVGPVTVGLSFMGLLDQRDASGDKIPNARTMKVGGSVDYNAELFGAGIKAFFGLDGQTDSDNATQIGVEPYFSYKVIPSHLLFSTDIGFYFTNYYNGTEKDLDNSNVRWAVRPQLFWNFMGTGANSYWGVGTGMVARYTVVSDAVNALDVTFKFAF